MSHDFSPLLPTGFCYNHPSLQQSFYTHYNVAAVGEHLPLKQPMPELHPAKLTSHHRTAEQIAAAEDSSVSDVGASPNPTGRRKPQKLAMQKRQASQVAQAPAAPQYAPEPAQEAPPDQLAGPYASGGRRIVPVHQSRISDRPAKVGEKDSSLKIKIELDLEVEVELYARVKGDVTIGLM